MRKVIFLLLVLVCSTAAFGQDVTEGSLFANDGKGKELGACPLKTTAVKTDISGFIARVTVRQEFENKFGTAIEAVYVFPLSHNGAVDRMTMTVGTRVINGKIMRREDARKTYETAKSEGKTASLLDQERPNIFTQSVANIMPGESVIVEISYVETLKYEDGAYEFVFPMTVAPRYIPSGVTDAAKISPPIAQSRNGSDISIEVNLNAGVPVEEVRSDSHPIDQLSLNANTSKITLRSEKTIPNKDFILRYDVTGKRIEDAFLAHRDPRGGFFTLVLQPPDKIATEDRTPKEIVFVLDTSGSMSGFPIEKAKEAMKLSLDGLYPDDTFNLITFAGDTAILFDKPVPATQANLERAQEFLATRRGYGGTEMMKAIKAALDPSDEADHLRIVCFMTDGEVGNDDQIIAEIQKHPKARVFSFGIGSSVNRSLLDKIAQEGKGEAAYVALNDDGSKAAKKFYERVRTPMLTDLSIEWNGMPVTDIYPNRLTDLFSAKPVVLHGRYTKAMSGTIKLKGNVAGLPYEREIAINLPETEAANDVLATLWARQRIDTISTERLKATPEKGAEMDKTITNIGLEFGLLTSFTSFVAVEDKVVNQSGKPVTVQVPVEQPEGTREQDTPFRKLEIVNGLQRPPAVTYSNGTGSAGVASQVVTVSGGSEVLQTESSKVRTTIQGRQIVSTPVQSRDALSLVTLLPGTTGTKTKGRTKSGKGSGKGGGGVGYGSGTGSGSGAGDGEASNTFTIQSLDESPVMPPPPPKTDGSPRVVSGGVLNGRTESLPTPVFPAAAKAVNATGTVAVQVTIDETGKVISATAVSGHPLLRAASEKAAAAAKFVPTMLSGVPVKVSGVIVYNYIDSTRSDISLEQMKVGPPTPEEKQRAVLAGKLQFWLYALVTRLAKGDTAAAANEAMFVRDNKAEIRIDLSTRNASVIDKLKAAGFEFVSDKDKTSVVGRVALDKLAALADIEEVKLILPKI